MRTPTAEQIEGFFHGCEHIISMAQKHVKENPNARASSILSMQAHELTTLALLAQYRDLHPGEYMEVPRIPLDAPSEKSAFRSVLHFIGEFLGAASIFALIFLIPWIYYALTGELLDFGGGQ